MKPKYKLNVKFFTNEPLFVEPTYEQSINYPGINGDLPSSETQLLANQFSDAEPYRTTVCIEPIALLGVQTAF